MEFLKTKIIAVVLSLFLADPAGATWTLVQHKCNAACGASASCNVGVTATGSGNLIVAKEINESGTSAQITSITGGSGTYTHCTTCNGGTSNDVDASYTTNSTAGSTTITLNLGATPSTWEACVDEFSSTVGGIALDGGASPTCHGVVATAAPVSCNLTITGTNDAISTAQVWTLTLTGVNSPYAGFDAPNGNGAGSNINTNSGTGAVWAPTTSGSGKNFSIAFKETAAAGGGGLNKSWRMEMSE